jgi:hypothetical protein
MPTGPLRQIRARSRAGLGPRALQRPGENLRRLVASTATAPTAKSQATGGFGGSLPGGKHGQGPATKSQATGGFRGVTPPGKHPAVQSGYG